jgi:hypothetical protein
MDYKQNQRGPDPTWHGISVVISSIFLYLQSHEATTSLLVKVTRPNMVLFLGERGRSMIALLVISHCSQE